MGNRGLSPIFPSLFFLLFSTVDQYRQASATGHHVAIRGTDAAGRAITADRDREFMRAQGIVEVDRFHVAPSWPSRSSAGKFCRWEIGFCPLFLLSPIFVRRTQQLRRLGRGLFFEVDFSAGAIQTDVELILLDLPCKGAET
jgi:hypothetical protein